MQWTKPDFQEITLNMEVTAYVNTEAKSANQRNQEPGIKEPGVQWSQEVSLTS